MKRDSATRNWNNFFTAEDFAHPVDKLDAEFWEQQKVHFEHIATIANAILREALAEARQVSGIIVDGESFWDEERDEKDTHTARLVMIEALRSEDQE